MKGKVFWVRRTFCFWKSDLCFVVACISLFFCCMKFFTQFWFSFVGISWHTVHVHLSEVVTFVLSMQLPSDTGFSSLHYITVPITQ